MLRDPDLVRVCEEPLVGLAQAAAQLDPGRPAEGPYPADVEQLARRSVRLGAVEADRAVEPDDLADHLRQLHDRQVVAGTDIDHALAGIVGHQPDARSEEHTSELQSLMRTSYAVFCLKKKN